MFSIIALMFIVAQALILATSADNSILMLPTEGIFLDRVSLTVWAVLLIGTLCVGWASNYLSRLALPGLRPISSLRLFIVVHWFSHLIGGQFNIWIDQVSLNFRGVELMAGLISLLGLATSHVMIIMVILASLVLGVELIINALIIGGRPQVFLAFRPVLVLFTIAATSKVIGEFGLMMIR